MTRLVALNCIPFRIVSSPEMKDLIQVTSQFTFVTPTYDFKSLNPKVRPTSVHTVMKLIPELADSSKEFFMKVY